MGRNDRPDLPRGSTKRSPPLSWTVFSLLGCPLTGHNWAAPLLIDRTPFQRLLILALLLIGGNVHLNPDPIRNSASLPTDAIPCPLPTVIAKIRYLQYHYWRRHISHSYLNYQVPKVSLEELLLSRPIR